MEVELINEDKNLIELRIIGEGHTLCNVLRSELWSLDYTSFVSYNLKHPLVSSPVFALKVKKGKPRKALLDAIGTLKDKNKHLKALLAKLS